MRTLGLEEMCKDQIQYNKLASLQEEVQTEAPGALREEDWIPFSV